MYMHSVCKMDYRGAAAPKKDSQKEFFFLLYILPEIVFSFLHLSQSVRFDFVTA